MRSVGARRRRALLCAALAVAGLEVSRARADEVSWHGFYTGAQLGGAWSAIDWQYQNANYFNTNGPTVVGNDFDHDPKGVIGGALGGFNYQAGPWVFGVELAASAADMNQERPSPLFPKLDVTTTSVNWLTSATGRLGYAWDRWLVFAKGGWAGGEVSATLHDVSAGVYASEDQWANGWTVGGGLEYMLCDRVSLGAAYDYVDLSINNKTVTCPSCVGVGPGFGIPIVDGDINVQSIMARLSFHQ